MTSKQGKSDGPGILPLLFRGFVGLAALAVGVGVFAALVATKPEPSRQSEPEPPLLISAVRARPVPVRTAFEGYGVARAINVVEVAAEVDGVVVEQPDSLEEGVRVDTGELLVRIEASDYEQAVKRSEETIASLEAQVDQLAVEEESVRSLVELAEQAAELVENELERLREAERRGAATANEIDRLLRDRTLVEREAQSLRERLASIPSRRQALRAQVEAERAAMATAQRNLERTAVLSPITGTVQRVDVERGERVRVGDPIARIVDPRRIEVPLRLPVSAASVLNAGDEATLAADGPSDRRWNATVARIAPEADPGTRTITVYVEVTQEVEPGAPPRLTPGAFLTGRVFAGTPEPEIVVPRGAVEDDRVYVLSEGGEVRSQPIEVGRYVEADYPEIDPLERQWAVVLAGLDEGDVVAVSNLTKLRPGMIVEAGFRSEVAEGDGR